MRSAKLTFLAFVALNAYAASPLPVAGDYLEVRSNEVFTCGCIYSGEYVTGGREAILAWNFRQGEIGNVPVADTRSVAVIQGKANLGLEGTSRQSVLFIDAATDSQRQALASALREQYAHVLGQILNIQYLPVSIEKREDRFHMRVGGTCEFVVRPARIPEDAHAGSALRYDPFVAATSSTLATTEYRRFSGPEFKNRWWSSEPGITGFIGTFSFRQ